MDENHTHEDYQMDDGTAHQPQMEYHPYLNGMVTFELTSSIYLSIFNLGRPCNSRGKFLPPNTPPPPTSDLPYGDWTPFSCRVGFETAEFLYTRSQMPASQIDTLLDLWTASQLKHGGSGPFVNHNNLYNTIDAAKLGDIPWENFKVKNQDGVAGEGAPSWKTDEFDVWYRNPRDVLRTMLANTDFDGEVDVAPYRNYDTDGEQQYQHLMSGDWAWTQAVSCAHIYFTIY
jgi:hypothetical protein